jgi:hypothetical protein
MDAQTASPALLLLLGNLPKTWQDPDVLPKLSADGQLYLRGDKCSAESRASIMNVSSAAREPVDQPCGGCGAKRRWKSVVHALHLMVRCIDCGCADHAGSRRAGGLQHLWLDAGGDILRRGAAIDLKVSSAA